MKLRTTGIIILAAIALVSLWAAASVSLAQDTGIAASAAPVTSPSVGPTAFLPGGSATGAPTIAVAVRNVSTPSATPVPSAAASTATPVPATTVVASPTAAAAQSGTTSGQLQNYGTDKDTFSRGEQATGFITVKNTGSAPINDLTVSVSGAAKLPVVGQATLGSRDYTFSDLNIQPGDTKRVEFKADIPSEYKGVSTAGDYSLHVTVKAGSTELGNFTKDIKVT